MTGFQTFSSAVREQGAHATIAILLLFIVGSSAMASTPTPTIQLGDEFGSIEIVRCHFDEGRVVIRLDDVLHVLHQSDRLANTGLTVVDISADSATLAIHGPEPTGHLRIFRVTNPPTNVIHIRELSTDPTALTKAKGIIGAPMATQAAQPPDPPSEN